MEKGNTSGLEFDAHVISQNSTNPPSLALLLTIFLHYQSLSFRKLFKKKKYINRYPSYTGIYVLLASTNGVFVYYFCQKKP